MFLFLVSISILILGGLLAGLLSTKPKTSATIGVISAVTGSLVGIVLALRSLVSDYLPAARWKWNVPYGEMHLAVDHLSAFFMLLVFGLGLLCSVYGSRYMLRIHSQKPIGPSFFFFNVLTASMAMFLAARNGMLFLTAWEVMAISSFFLVTFEHERADVRNAGWTYLVTAHIGTAFLLAFFAILQRESGSMDFDGFAQLGELVHPTTASVLFILAIIGFGTKAGFIPFHIWLPEAHPAAPSHVSAIMSGVMIKMGIYGILRTLTFLGTPPSWWGILLMGIGTTSGLVGVLFALAQHDLKRLLAYHSIENIGIISLGMGLGVWGVSTANPLVALLGFSGAILHVANHAIFKGLLFLGAGAVLYATGEREMDRLGGLLKKMPVTGATFLIGAAAISGLPPLNGFISEFLILFGGFSGISKSSPGAIPLLVVVVALGTIGALAATCFVKAFGITFLGTFRREDSSEVREAEVRMLVPMVLLAVMCILIGTSSAQAVRLVLPVAAELAGVSPDEATAHLAPALSSLNSITIAVLGFMALVAALALLRHVLLSKRSATREATWGCGYEMPTAKMQYTSGSFAQPITGQLAVLLRPSRILHTPAGYFPKAAFFHSETPDVFTVSFYRPILVWFERISSWLHWLQRGRIHLYLLYIFITLAIVLVWRLRL